MTASLGPSNDDSPQVRLEMIAADRIAGIASHGGGESDVWCDDETTEFAGGPWQDQFNAALWSWDISRPLAEQFAETPADDAVSGTSEAGTTDRAHTEDEIDAMADDGRLTGIAMRMAIASGVDWTSLAGEEQDDWHEHAIQRLRVGSDGTP